MRRFIHKRTEFIVNAKMPIDAAKKVATNLYKNKAIKTKQFNISDIKTGKVYHFIATKEKEKLIVKAKHKKLTGGKYEDWVAHDIKPSQILNNQLVVIYDKVNKKYISINQLSEDYYNYYNLSKHKIGKSLHLTDSINSESVFRAHTYVEGNYKYLYFELEITPDIVYYLAYRPKYNHIYDKDDKKIDNILYLDSNPINNNSLYFLLKNNTIVNLSENYIVKQILPRLSFITQREIGESSRVTKRRRL